MNDNQVESLLEDLLERIDNDTGTSLKKFYEDNLDKKSQLEHAISEHTKIIPITTDELGQQEIILAMPVGKMPTYAKKCSDDSHFVIEQYASHFPDEIVLSIDFVESLYEHIIEQEFGADYLDQLSEYEEDLLNDDFDEDDFDEDDFLD